MYKEMQFTLLILLFKWVSPTSLYPHLPHPHPPHPQERNIIYLGKAHSRASKKLDSEFSKEQHSILGPANA